MFEIGYADGMTDDFRKLRRRDRIRILDEIDEQLTHEPTKTTRNKKLIRVKAPWRHDEPLRELRIGEFRVFYDVDEEAEIVMIRAVRHKPPHKTTEDIL